MTEKINCWEFKKCGREPGGKNEQEYGPCPAAIENKLDGIHGGTNAGRACWVITGTFCDENIQGSFATKYDICTNCDFHRIVKEEELDKFKLSVVLISKIL